LRRAGRKERSAAPGVGYLAAVEVPLLWLLSSLAFGQDAVTMSAVRFAQDGLSTPSITFKANVDGHMAVTLGCAGRSFNLATAISAGQSYPITLAGLPRGSTRCTGSLALDAADGTTGQMPLSLGIEVLPPLKLIASRADLDLVKHLVTVHGDRPLSRVHVDAIGEGGGMIGSGDVQGAPQPAMTIEWTGSAEPVKLAITGYDEHDLPGSLELSPWSYDIPHEDVVFASDQSTIADTEVPKLERAYADLEKVLLRYGAVVQVKLFVAGYTDTVGDGAHNQVLSEARAKTIGTWFRSRGFKGEIRYQGFGEGALAVSTADEVDELRNRRAKYVLAAEEPARSGDIPRSQWKQIP
jgi:hypothetical protein